MNWETFYLTTFVIGFLLSVLSFVGGALRGGHFHFHGHAHGIGHGHHIGGKFGRGGLSVFNFGTLTAFLAWFGGAGYLLQRYSTILVYFALLLSVVAGCAGASVVFWFMAKLTAEDRPLDPADYEMVGVLGRVTSPIRALGTGEVLFLRDGARKATPARSEDASEIPRDAEVIVTRYEKGVAYVRRWEEIP